MKVTALALTLAAAAAMTPDHHMPVQKAEEGFGCEYDDYGWFCDGVDDYGDYWWCWGENGDDEGECS